MKRLFTSLLSCLAVMLCMAQYTQLTNIPTMYIETFGNKAVTSRTTYVYATMTYVDGSNVVRYDSMQIRGRGNSTWNLAKKPYRIKFKESTKFLGKGYAKNKSWTLLANHGDKSLLRNAVTSTMGRFLGQPFNPAAHFVDLYLNGTYLGNYQVSDQVNVDNKRVEIYEQEDEATSSSNITGGYLVEVDGFGTGEEVYFRTNKNVLVSVKSPDEDVINTAQYNYIRNYLNVFESLLFSSSFQDPDNGYRVIVDSTTLVSWYIATELSANVDGFWSTYLYKDRDDPKLYFGPLWDYDIAYNNCSRVGDVTYRDMIESGFGDDLTKVWMKRMLQDPWFNEAVNDAWKQKVNEGLEQYLYNYIDSMAARLDRSQQKNYGKYSIASKVYNEIYLYSTYADYISQLKRFIGDHMEFLTTRFAERANDVEKPVEPLKPFELIEGYYYRVYNKGANKVLDIDDDGESIMIWSPLYGRDTQLWEVVPVGEYYHLLNRATGMALNDPSRSSAVGTPLNVVESNPDDPRQLWKFVTVNENENFNIINVYTDHVMNNSGGSAADGNEVISYTNDDRNSVSNNRQWRITPEELMPDYIPDEVKETLAITIADAEEFLANLPDDQVGMDIFCYSALQIDVLRQMVADAKIFESTVLDDYILTIVNLTEQQRVASMRILPAAGKRYVIRHKESGHLLTMADSKVVIMQPDASNDGQYFVFESTDFDDDVYLKSGNGLYVSLGTSYSSVMIGRESADGNGWSTLNVTLGDGCHYLHTVAGLMGTSSVSDKAAVYANRRQSSSREVKRAEWIIEEYVDVLANVQAALETVIAQAQYEMSILDKQWIGDSPMQHSPEGVDALNEAIDEALTYPYASVEDYEEMIQRLAEAMASLHVLNTPDEDAEYHLAHLSGYNLSCEDGLVFAIPDMEDAAQRFRLIPVDDAVNTYNIYTNGLYVTVVDEALALTETPRDEWGQFVAHQVSPSSFTLQSVLGYLGAKGTAQVGEPCVGNAENEGSNICWQLVKASGSPVEDGITPHSYMGMIDYVLVYDKEAHTLRFVSEDMEVLSKVDVQIYTVGGRLLYTFKASEQQSLAELPSGTYIARWTLGTMTRSVKFKK